MKINIPSIALAALLAGPGSIVSAAIVVETSFGGSAAAPTGDTGFTGYWVTTAGGSTASSATFTSGDMPNLPDAYTNSGFVNSGNYLQTQSSPAFRSLATPIDVESAGTYYFSFLYSVNGFDDVAGGGVSFFSGTTERIQVGLGDDEQMRIFHVPEGDPAGEVQTAKTFDTTNAEAIWVVGKLTTASGIDSVDLTFFSGADAVPASESWLINKTMTLGANLDTLRFNSPGSPSTAQRFDEFRIGETWADVTAIPEPSSLALIALAAAAGLTVLRRRR